MIYTTTPNPIQQTKYTGPKRASSTISLCLHSENVLVVGRMVGILCRYIRVTQVGGLRGRAITSDLKQGPGRESRQAQRESYFSIYC